MLPSDPGARYIPPTDRTDWYQPDEHLRWLARRAVGEELWPTAEAALQELGTLVPQTIEPLARTADRNPPVLRSYDARGQRIDEIEFHPAYRELEAAVLRFGAVHAAYATGWHGLSGRAPRTLITAMLYLLLESDQAVTGCPVGMMDAAARCLERNDPALAARFVPGITDDTGHHLTVAMFLTEKAGGSDVGANETVATRADDGTWRLTGEKWFASCPHSDLILVLARPEGAPPGPRGLGLFLMPRVLDDGTRNTFIVHRLKEKFGTRAMASGEVGLRGAFAWQVGAIDRGLPQMMDMVNATRIGIATATAGAMRRSAFEALSHTHGRSTFGRRLDLHPLMRDTLAELVVDSVAGLTAAMGVAELADSADAGDIEAAAALRLLTPLFKMHGTERARICATEGMEARGGNGFIEDWPDARILRDVYVHAIWEGSGNVIALDVQRAIEHGALPGYLSDTERRGELVSSGGPCAPLASVIVDALRRLESQLQTVRGIDDADARQLPLRRVARRMATLAIGARLAEQANAFAADTGSGRLGWIAARYLCRLGGEPALAQLADDAAWLEHADPLLHGGHVPLDIASTAAQRTVAALHSTDALVSV
ncbi:MAG TPA: acyl-CoA dehydrogenase family protein [Candidatus Saccharimonadales bacterium]|nr:acyl-CoA dehydrogenase family protein [Candidatus Saccharimonadales bacterium]